jgi:hypothetical protein
MRRAASPFANNRIPLNRTDPVARRVHALIPLPAGHGLVNNYLPSYPSLRSTTIPTVNLDELIGSRESCLSIARAHKPSALARSFPPLLSKTDPPSLNGPASGQRGMAMMIPDARVPEKTLFHLPPLVSS